MTRVTLVRVDTTMGAVCAAAGFLERRVSKTLEKLRHCPTYGSLLNDDALDGQVFNVNVLGIRVRLSVLQETRDELDALLGPPT